jgi:hypothetical protein
MAPLEPAVKEAFAYLHLMRARVFREITMHVGFLKMDQSEITTPPSNWYVVSSIRTRT